MSFEYWLVEEGHVTSADDIIFELSATEVDILYDIYLEENLSGY